MWVIAGMEHRMGSHELFSSISSHTRNIFISNLPTPPQHGACQTRLSAVLDAAAQMLADPVDFDKRLPRPSNSSLFSADGLRR